DGDAYGGVYSAGAPVPDPASGRTLGTIAIVGPARDASPLVLAVAERAAREVGQRLIEAFGAHERFLEDHFARARRHARGAVALVSPDRLLTNAAGARLVGDADKAALWEWAAAAVPWGGRARGEVELASGRTVSATSEPVSEGGTVVAAVVRLAAPGASPAPPARHGGASLTETQLAVAERGAVGRTKPEEGAEPV